MDKYINQHSASFALQHVSISKPGFENWIIGQGSVFRGELRAAYSLSGSRGHPAPQASHLEWVLPLT